MTVHYWAWGMPRKEASNFRANYCGDTEGDYSNYPKDVNCEECTKLFEKESTVTIEEALTIQRDEARAELAQARADHQSEVDALRVERNVTARELTAATAEVERLKVAWESDARDAATEVERLRAELATCRGRVSDLKFAMGDNAGWFDRFNAERAEVKRLKVEVENDRRLIKEQARRSLALKRERLALKAELATVAERQREADAKAIRHERLKRKEDVALAVFLESVVRTTPLVTAPRVEHEEGCYSLPYPSGRSGACSCVLAGIAPRVEEKP